MVKGWKVAPFFILGLISCFQVADFKNPETEKGQNGVAHKTSVDVKIWVKLGYQSITQAVLGCRVYLSIE